MVIIEPDCPVCEANDWEVIGKRTYSPVPPGNTSTYLSSHLDVLFQVWQPGADVITLRSILCKRCGFVCYDPRPTEQDVSRKYAYLSENEATAHEISQLLDSDRRRSSSLYYHLAPYLDSRRSILDFGGGNGRLMLNFIERGYECSLVDYDGDKIPGITYYGASLGDIPSGHAFDVIICSHVLEHLANPKEAISSFREYLAVDGVLYIEVPLEIWDGAPLPSEPVTHINYFTRRSLEILGHLSGYRVITCREGPYINEAGKTGIALRMFAQKNKNPAERIEYGGSAAATKALLFPSPSLRIVRLLKYPQITFRKLRRWAFHRLSRLPVVWRLAPWLAD